MAKGSKNGRIIEVRYGLPSDVHKKIKSHRRLLESKKDADVTMEQALIDFVRTR